MGALHLVEGIPDTFDQRVFDEAGHAEVHTVSADFHKDPMGFQHHAAIDGILKLSSQSSQTLMQALHQLGALLDVMKAKLRCGKH